MPFETVHGYCWPQSAAAGEQAEEGLAVLVATVLAPEGAEHAKLDVVGLAPEALDEEVVFVAAEGDGIEGGLVDGHWSLVIGRWSLVRLVPWGWTGAEPVNSAYAVIAALRRRTRPSCRVSGIPDRERATSDSLSRTPRLPPC